MDEKGFYIYCVAEGSREEDLGLKGIGGGPVRAIPSQGLIAVVQECDKPFSSEDMKVVSEWLLTHQAVVDFAWERFETVVPCSFGTIVVEKDGKSPRENLLEWLVQEGDRLKEKIGSFKGKAEYGVQISWDPSRVSPRLVKNDPEIQSLDAEIRSKPAGTAYLLRQKMEEVLRHRLEVAADAYFKEFYRKIRSSVEDVRVEKVRKEDLPRQMLANLSCLALKVDAGKLGEELERISKIEGFSVRFTGPWPPYSFVS